MAVEDILWWNNPIISGDLFGSNQKLKNVWSNMTTIQFLNITALFQRTNCRLKSFEADISVKYFINFWSSSVIPSMTYKLKLTICLKDPLQISMEELFLTLNYLRTFVTINDNWRSYAISQNFWIPPLTICPSSSIYSLNHWSDLLWYSCLRWWAKPCSQSYSRNG